MSELQRWLILPDSHTPYHNVNALEKLIIGKVVPAFDWYGVCVLGDFFDCYSVSSYNKDPLRLDDLGDEIQTGFDLLHVFELLPLKRRIFVEGNHEDRLPRFLEDKAPALYKMVKAAWHANFTAGGWEYVPYQTDTTIGSLFVTHDVGHAGAMSTRQTLHAYQHNVIIGHNHNMLYLVEGNAKGTPHVGASFGWLGDPEKIDYMHRMKARRNWTTGFGVGYHDPETDFVYLTPHPIIENTCMLEGQLFTL